MKKYKLLFYFAVNISIIFLLFLFTDFYIFSKDAKKYIQNKNSVLKYYYNFITGDISEEYIKNRYINGKNFFYHPVLNKESNESPILVFGCSFIYGHNIPIEATFSQVLKKYTTRPIYDRSFHGWGINQMLYQLKNEDFYKIIPEPKFIIYNYFFDHKNRLKRPCTYSIKDYYGTYYKLIKKQDKFLLVEKKHSVLYNKSNLIARISDKFSDISDPNEKIFLLQHLLEAKKEADKHWKNTKFIIIEYYQDDDFDAIKPDLEKNGITVIDRNELVPFNINDERYCLSKKDCHPNDKAWELIIPELVKTLNSTD